jgi:hypothetical protein
LVAAWRVLRVRGGGVEGGSGAGDELTRSIQIKNQVAR